MRAFRHAVKQCESCLTFAVGLTSSTTTVARKQEQMSQERELLMRKKKGGRTAVLMEKIRLVYHCYFDFSFRYQKLAGVRIQFQIPFIFHFLQSYEIAYLPISESKPHDRHTPSYSSISSLLSCLLQNNPYNYCFFFCALNVHFSPSVRTTFLYCHCHISLANGDSETCAEYVCLFVLLPPHAHSQASTFEP